MYPTYSQERAKQLQATKELCDEGLYISALLITGMHLSTVTSETPEENEFRYESLLQLSNCLFHTDEAKRRDYYYEQAQSIASTLENLDKKDLPEVDKKHNNNNAEEPMTLEQRIKRARVSKEALQNSTMRIHDKVREAKAAVEPSVMLTRPVPKSIPEVKVRPSQGMYRIMTGDTAYSGSAASSRGSRSGSSGGLGSTGINDQRKHDLYKPAIEFAAKSIAAGNYKRAKELIRKIDPFVVDDMYHYAAVLVDLEQEQEVDELSQYLLATNDKHPDTWCVLAFCWEHKGQREKALQMINRNMATYTGLVECYMMLERYAEAISACKELRRLVPDSAHALAMFGNAISHSRDHATHMVEEAYREALRMDPACLEASDGLCMILGSQFRNDEALELLDKQIDYNRVDEAHVKKARIYMGMEQWRSALLNYQQALFANPKNLQAKAGREQVERIMCGLDDDDADYDDE
ncbi:Anaphase-promoting complex subunit 7 [Podila horticola]|nr:Anaphase-promoting complex subunit 7 [Podila horticola]